jgi:hypothetical protein
MIRCTVVEVFEPGQTMEHDRFSTRDLLPWADPYIAQLIARHEGQLASEPWQAESDSPWDVQGFHSGVEINEASPSLGGIELPNNRFGRRGL